jgi:hypothetical protein
MNHFHVEWCGTTTQTCSFACSLVNIQKAKKIACNSAYGILGSTVGMLPLPDLAAVTTFTGREALMFSKKHAEEKYGAFVVGGDTGMSIMNDHEPTRVTWLLNYFLCVCLL